MNKRRIAILGSTGSIGTQALKVIEEHPDVFTAEVLTANSNVALLARQARKFKPDSVVIADESKYNDVSGFSEPNESDRQFATWLGWAT